MLTNKKSETERKIFNTDVFRFPRNTAYIQSNTIVFNTHL